MMLRVMVTGGVGTGFMAQEFMGWAASVGAGMVALALLCILCHLAGVER